MIGSSDFDAWEIGASGENQVKLVPMLRPRMSPGDSVMGPGVEESVADTEIVMTAELQQPLTIFVHLPQSEVTKACWP